MALVQNNIVDTISNLTSTFTMSFQIYPQGTINEHNNILRYASTTDNSGNHRDRWLLFFFSADSYSIRFIAGSAVDSDKALGGADGIVGLTWNNARVETISDEIKLYINKTGSWVCRTSLRATYTLTGRAGRNGRKISDEPIHPEAWRGP